MLPLAGRYAARNRGEPVSGYMLTDAEREMRQRSYRLVMPIHRRDFFARAEAEAVRARLWPDGAYRVDPTSYYRLQRRDGFVSEAGRYGALRSEIDADTGLLGPFYDTVRLVYGADRRRLDDLWRTSALTAGEEADALARVYENRRVVEWALVALAWRLESYGYALQRLRIEVPSPLAGEAEADLAALAWEIDALAAAVAALEFDLEARHAPVAPLPAVVKR